MPELSTKLREAAPPTGQLDVAELRSRVATRRRTRRRRVVGSIVAGVVVLALLVVAIGSVGDDSTINTRTRRTPPANTVATGPIIAVPDGTSTTSPLPAPAALDPRLGQVQAMGGTADPTLPPGWLRCVNSVKRFSIGAPADWYTATVALYEPAPGPSGMCSLFDPQPFRLDSEVTASLMIQDRGEPFDAATSRVAPPCCDLLEQRDAVVDGRRAVYQVYTTLQGVFQGATWACYVVDRDGEAFSVCTVGANGSPVFAERVDLLHRAVATLRFT